MSMGNICHCTSIKASIMMAVTYTHINADSVVNNATLSPLLRQWANLLLTDTGWNKKEDGGVFVIDDF